MPDDISFRLQRSFDAPESSPPTVIRLVVGPDVVFDMLPNPMPPGTAIRPSSLQDLVQRGIVPTAEARRVVLNDLRIAGQPLPDLEARVSPAIARLGVDGALGLDFFARFDEVVWQPSAGRMTLQLP